MMNVGRIHSFQSLGTVDGPGVRFVVFMQGCPLRCKCCHNPDTWDFSGGKEYTAETVLQRIVRFKEYFGENGGVTVSGGEPLMQAKFVSELFKACHKEGISTCLDTSGCVINDEVRTLLDSTDRVLLDIKYANDSLYREYVGTSLFHVLDFLSLLYEKNVPTTVRQVTIPTLNDSEEAVLELLNIAESYPCVDKIELLPFRKICEVKYKDMGIDFPLSQIPEPDFQKMQDLKALLGKYYGE